MIRTDHLFRDRKRKRGHPWKTITQSNCLLLASLHVHRRDDWARLCALRRSVPVRIPPELVEVFRTAKRLSDRHTSALEQDALADFIQSAAYERARETAPPKKRSAPGGLA